MKKFTVHGFRRKFFRDLDVPLKQNERYIDCLIWEVDEHLENYTGDVYNSFPRISVPESEFCELVGDLPCFTDLPITGLAWDEANQPTKFIVECFDIDEKIMIDTSGYDYPRYKAAIT